MKISEQQVRYVADLANLTLTPNEIQRMAHDLDEILTHIDTLNEVETAGVEPMAQVLFEAEETAMKLFSEPTRSLLPATTYWKNPQMLPTPLACCASSRVATTR